MRKYIYLLAAFFTVVSDQLTKYLVRNFIDPSDSFSVLPFLNIVSVRNKGAAFGLFRSFGNIPFIAVSIIAIIFILYLMFYIPEPENGNRKTGYYTGLSLILGGAIGNFIDRIFIGSVVDFIDVFAGRFHWPAFNIADSALTVGVILMLFTIKTSTGHERSLAQNKQNNASKPV